MIDEVFLEADVITCPEILGVQLRPLSIWHSWALRSIESPFIEGGEYSTDDVCNAILVCSLTRSEYSNANQMDIAARLGEIAANWLRLDDDARSETLDCFNAYLDACTRFPEFWRSEDSDPVRDRLRCPAEWHLVATLTNMHVCTESEAWDYPISRAQCWQAVEGERAGSQAYVDQRDRQDFEKLNKQEGGGNG